MAPTKMPVLLPSRLPGRIRASSKASQASSRTSRCCGSIARASCGEMPKKAASKDSASVMNPPRRSTGPPAPVSHRPCGTSPVASRPEASSSQNAAGPSAPGNLHDRPITAIGSFGARSVSDAALLPMPCWSIMWSLSPVGYERGCRRTGRPEAETGGRKAGGRGLGGLRPVQEAASAAPSASAWSACFQGSSPPAASMTSHGFQKSR